MLLSIVSGGLLAALDFAKIGDKESADEVFERVRVVGDAINDWEPALPDDPADLFS